MIVFQVMTKMYDVTPKTLILGQILALEVPFSDYNENIHYASLVGNRNIHKLTKFYRNGGIIFQALAIHKIN